MTINEKLLPIKTLYENATGTKNNITLADTIENYKYIGVFVRNNSNNFLHAEQKFFTNYSTSASIQLNLLSNGNGAVDVKGLRCLINGSSLNMSYYYKATIIGGQTPSTATGTNPDMYIYKVIGYK